MSYRVELTRRAEQDLERLGRGNRVDVLQVAEAIAGLVDGPQPSGVKTLAGEEGLCRLRSGDCRIIYKVEEAGILVLAVKIGDRKEVYRYLKKLE